ncbi:MAG: hypothetical protein HUJ88_11630 [Fusobacterium necrophorum]|nr:hypothetical protein [Fusobacterium necrophorum]
MVSIVKSKESKRIDRISDCLKELDSKSLEAFENVLIGFNMAQNFNLMGCKNPNTNEKEN